MGGVFCRLSVRSGWLLVLFKSSVSFLVFYVILSITESGIVKSSVVEFSISSFISVRFASCVLVLCC